MKNKPGPKPKNHEGERHGKLLVVEYVMHKEHGAWRCVCDCGNESIVQPNALKRRIGCKSCTAQIVGAKRFSLIPHLGYKNRLLREYKQSAKKRNLEFNLSQDVFFKLLEGNCFYCGIEPKEHGGQIYMVKAIAPFKRNGIDRFDTTKGYIKENCVSCCSNCNYAKHEMSIEHFKKWVIRLCKNLFNKSSTTIPEGSTSQVNGDGSGNPPINEEDDMVYSASKDVAVHERTG